MSTDNIKKVLVLVATYNGEKYLREQLDSIINQKGVKVDIKVADDCSTDSTKYILEEYKNKYSNFDYYVNEKNKHFTYNFIDLLFSVKDTKYDYYAFADQDDYWLENKLYNAICKIEEKNSNKGCLYCSNLKLADENLVEYGIQENKSILKTKKHSYLVSNIATGCTIVFDYAMFLKATKYYPENIYLHDYWIFLIAVYTADYIYDINSYILYRQHSSQMIGSNKKFFNKNKLKNFVNPKHPTSILLKQFLNSYGKELSDEDYKYVSIAANYNAGFKNKMKLLFSNKIKRRKYDFLFKVKVLLGKF